MKKGLSLFFLLMASSCISGQYFQQQVDHKIQATLDTNQHKLHVDQEISYKNNAPISLDTIYFHLWANAFSSHTSAFANQRTKLGKTDFYFADEKAMGGFINLQLLKNGSIEYHESQPDLAYVVLDKVLLPGASIILTLSYDLNIPSRWSRLGRQGNIYHLTHWYVKPAVYDNTGWHWFPYLSMGEFYSEFGDYEIEIIVPKGYLLAGSGVMDAPEATSGEMKYTLHGENIIDAALFLSPELTFIRKKYHSKGGNKIDLFVYYSAESELWEEKAMGLLEASMEFYETEIGPYPYDRLTLVDGQEDCNCGMEYPMVIKVSAADEKSLDYYINHEVGHQWFYGVLAFNEREEAFMDEGLTTFYEHKYTRAKLGTEYHTAMQSIVKESDLEMPLLQYAYLFQKRRNLSESPSEEPGKQSMVNYGINVYERAAYAYKYLESYLGKPVFSNGIKAFYQKWKLKHPALIDFVAVMESESGKKLDWFIPLISEDVTIDFSIRKDGESVIISNNGDTRLPFMYTIQGEDVWEEPLMPRESRKVGNSEDGVSVNKGLLGWELNGNDNNDKGRGIGLNLFTGLDNSSKKELFFLPLLTYNYADGIGLGGAIHNSTITENEVAFLIAPQFGITSKNLIGNAWMRYNLYPENSSFRKIQFKLSVKRYSDFYSELNEYRTQYSRWTPQVSFHFRKAPGSQKYAKLTARTLFLKEGVANFSGPGEFELESDFSLIHQIRYDYFDFISIGRKELWIEAEQQSYDDPFGNSQNYLKLSGAIKYEIPYAERKGVQFRLYGGGFLKNTQRGSSSFNSVLSRGSFALLNQGFNDYQKEEYIINRQANQGPSSNQINYARGGGFKDALGPQYSIGLSNDMAFSMNLSADVPFPLPIFLKVRPYVDLGYYRSKSVSTEQLTGRTLYSGGLKLSVIDGALEVYFPLIASKTIADIYGELGENIFQKISFSIDLHRINPWDLKEDFNR